MDFFSRFSLGAGENIGVLYCSLGGLVWPSGAEESENKYVKEGFLFQ